MAQFLRPDGTLQNTSITGTHTAIDEASASDADFLYSADQANTTYECSLSNPASTPGSGTVTCRFRSAQVDGGVVSGSGNAASMTAYLYQGATLISTGPTVSAEGAWTANSWAPSSGELATITDWTDLRLLFVMSGSGGPTANRRGYGISWAEVETPDGVVTSTGTASYTEANDTLAAGGATPIAAIAAITEGSDAIAAGGAVATTGIVAYSDGNDTTTAAGAVSLTGATAYTDADDTLAAAGGVQGAIDGVAAYTEAGDTAAAAGAVAVTAATAYTEAGDTAAMVGAVTVTGATAYTEADDAPASAGTVLVSGATAGLEADDTLASAGASTLTGTATYTDADDAVAAAGAVALVGSAAYTEAGDSLVSMGGEQAAIDATASITEDDDVVAAVGIAVADEATATPLGGATSASQTSTWHETKRVRAVAIARGHMAAAAVVRTVVVEQDPPEVPATVVTADSDAEAVRPQTVIPTIEPDWSDDDDEQVVMAFVDSFLKHTMSKRSRI